MRHERNGISSLINLMSVWSVSKIYLLAVVFVFVGHETALVIFPHLYLLSPSLNALITTLFAKHASLVTMTKKTVFSWNSGIFIVLAVSCFSWETLDFFVSVSAPGGGGGGAAGVVEREGGRSRGEVTEPQDGGREGGGGIYISDLQGSIISSARLLASGSWGRWKYSAGSFLCSLLTANRWSLRWMLYLVLPDV
jgi:hypothetical protein